MFGWKSLVLVGVGIAIGFGGYFLIQSQKENNLSDTVQITDQKVSTSTPSSSQNIKTPTAPASTNTVFTGSLKELLQSGRSSSCTFSKNDGRGDVHGTLMVSKNKMRGDFVLRSAGAKAYESNVVYDGNMAYAWFDDGEKGVKFRIDVEDLDKYTAQSGTISLNEKFEFHCTPWTSSGTEFAPPGDIPFTDITLVVNFMRS